MREEAGDSWDSRQDSRKGVLAEAFAVAAVVPVSSSEGGFPLMEEAPS